MLLRSGQVASVKVKPATVRKLGRDPGLGGRARPPFAGGLSLGARRIGLARSIARDSAKVLAVLMLDESLSLLVELAWMKEGWVAKPWLVVRCSKKEEIA